MSIEVFSQDDQNQYCDDSRLPENNQYRIMAMP